MVAASIFLKTLILFGGTPMGKKGHDLPKNLRQELVLNILENFSGESGISTADIFELLDNRCPGVNKRTLYRDLEELSLRYPIYDDEREGKIHWFIKVEEMFKINDSLFRSYLKKELLNYFLKEQELTPEAV